MANNPEKCLEASLILNINDAIRDEIVGEIRLKILSVKEMTMEGLIPVIVEVNVFSSYSCAKNETIPIIKAELAIRILELALIKATIHSFDRINNGLPTGIKMNLISIDDVLKVSINTIDHQFHVIFNNQIDDQNIVFGFDEVGDIYVDL